MFWRIKKICRGLKRGFSWGIFMFTNEEWDHFFLYEMLYKRLGELEKYFKNPKLTNGLCHYSYARTIHICRHYLYETKEAYPVEKIMRQFDEKFGRADMITEPWKDDDTAVEYKGLKFEKCKTEEENKYANRVFSRIGKTWMYRDKKNKKKFFSIFEKYVDYWWD